MGFPKYVTESQCDNKTFRLMTDSGVVTIPALNSRRNRVLRIVPNPC